MKPQEEGISLRGKLAIATVFFIASGLAKMLVPEMPMAARIGWLASSFFLGVWISFSL